MVRRGLCVVLGVLFCLGFSNARGADVSASVADTLLDGTIPTGAPFFIDIAFFNNVGNITGLQTPMVIYSPDNSILNISHRNAGGNSPQFLGSSGTWEDYSIVEMNDWLSYWEPFFGRWYATSWEGALPDSVFFVGATNSSPWGMCDTTVYYRFALMVEEAGTLCLDSTVIINPQNTYDWVFFDEIAFEVEFKFNGPYCWTVNDGSGDLIPPVMTCPADIAVGCGESAGPEATGFATATDDQTPNPSIAYSDQIVTGQCPTIRTINRTWTAIDYSNNISQCTQMITEEDRQAPLITCPPNMVITSANESGPEFTGYATATDDCDINPQITYSDSQTGNMIVRTWGASDACGGFSECRQEIGLYICGDINGDGSINILDILYMIDFKFWNGPEPVCP